jgi:hypothetical protein
METLKRFITKHFEKILVMIILIAAFIGTYVIEEKSIVLNFYYLPVPVTSWGAGWEFSPPSSLFWL